MSEYSREDYINYRIAQAEDTIEAAELLIENNKLNSAVNRLYYACYYAVSALLLKGGILAKSHAGVKTQFLLHFVKSGKIDKAYGRLYANLFDWRQRGDYGDFINFDPDSIQSLLMPCKELMAEIKKLLKE